MLDLVAQGKGTKKYDGIKFSNNLSAFPGDFSKIKFRIQFSSDA